MSWDFVRNFFWLPFVIMQRITRNIFLLSRNLFGSKPAIMPKPPSANATEPESETTISIQPEPVITKITDPVPGTSTSPSMPTRNYAVVNIGEVIQPNPSREIGTDLIEADSDNKSQHYGNLSASVTEQIVDKKLNVVVIAGEEERGRVDSNDVTTSHSLTCSPAQLQLAFVNEIEIKQVESTEVEDDDTNRSRAKQKRFNSDTKRMRQDDSPIVLKDYVTTSSALALMPKRPKLAFAQEEEDRSVSVASTSSASASAKTTASSQAQTSTLGNSLDKKKKKRPKKKGKHTIERTEGLGEKSKETNTMGRYPPPNFFVAVQVSNKDIVDKVGQLQNKLSEKNLDPPWHTLKSTEIFRDAMVPLTKLHFTLYVMNLKDEKEEEKARLALAQCGSEVFEEFRKNPLDLNITGLGHFKNSVIYAQIKGDEDISRLTKLSELVRAKLDAQNIAGDPRPFKPHMTIAKISRSNKLHKMKIRSFPPNIWDDCENTIFGKQRVNGIQLLSMRGEDKVTGYYQCSAECSFYRTDSLSNSNPSGSPSISSTCSPSPSQSISNPPPNIPKKREESDSSNTSDSNTASNSNKNQLQLKLQTQSQAKCDSK